MLLAATAAHSEKDVTVEADTHAELTEINSE